MKIIRETKIKADKFQIGDKIELILTGRVYKATAIRDGGDWMLFLFDEYLSSKHSMNEKLSRSKAYEDSGLRMFLQDFAGLFARKYIKRMVPFNNGDLLRILSMTEMFGVDDGSGTRRGQIAWMKDHRHRIAYLNGRIEYGWTATGYLDGKFTSVSWDGHSELRFADEELGVRPVFKMLHPLQYEKQRLKMEKMKTRKIVFLDVDGVLNSMPYLEAARSGKMKNEGEICSIYLQRLKEIIEKTGANIVLSSTWRVMKECEDENGIKMYRYLENRLNEYGLRIYGQTGDADKRGRVYEILTWVKENAPDAIFVSLDDDFAQEDYERYGIGDCLVHTKYFGGSMDECGLQDIHVQKAVNILLQQEN